MIPEDIFDVIIVGGSYAGLSAGLVLGRSLRRVLIVDNNRPCNRQTPHAHSFLTRDGQAPHEIAAVARAQVAQYPNVSFWNGKVVEATQPEAGLFHIQTEAGDSAFGCRVILATGITDELPAIEGFAACWGISVLHCPYCHGYEVRHQKLGVLANSARTSEFVQLLFNWSTDLVVFTNGTSKLSAEHTAEILARGIPIIETEIASITHTAGQLNALQLTDGTSQPLTALFAHVPFHQSGSLAQELGCELNEGGLIQCSEFGETSVPGVYAVGDNCNPMRQLAVAVASGVKAAAWLNRELIQSGVYSQPLASIA